MARQICFDTTGGPEVLRLRETPVVEPGSGEARVRVDAIGVNRADAMFREGRYFYPPTLPSGLGYEAAGVVEAIGPDVTGVAWATASRSCPRSSSPTTAPTGTAWSCPRSPSCRARWTAIPSPRRRPGAAIEFVEAGLADGSFTPTVDRVFDFTDFAAAHRHQASGTQFGKIVLTVRH